MIESIALATLPVAALGCAIHAVWSLYHGLKEFRLQSRGKRRRREHPVATAVQAVLFVGFCVALAMTGLSIFGKTAGQSPYAYWLKLASHEPSVSGEPVVTALNGLPGTFEVIRSRPARPVVGANLSHLPATDLDIARLAERCPDLKWLHLHNTQVTDQCLDSLCRLGGLRVVSLSQTSITDQGLKELTHLHDLEDLQLSRTEVSDAGLAYLGIMSSLKYLDLSETKVSRRAVRKLRTRLPNCVIRYRKSA